MKSFQLLPLIVALGSFSLQGMESKSQELFAPRSSRSSVERQLIDEAKHALARDVIEVDTATAAHNPSEQTIVYDEKYEATLRDLLYNPENICGVAMPKELIQIILSYMPYIVKGKCVKTLTYTDRLMCLIELANGHIAFGAKDGDIQVWDPATSECVKTLKGGGAETIQCLIQLSNGEIASCSNDKTIKVWNLATDECKTLIGHKGAVLCLIQLSNGQLASGSSDEKIKIWNPNTGGCLTTLKGHGNRGLGFGNNVECLVQLAEGLFSGAEDRTIKAWDLSTGQCLKTLRGHKDEVKCLTKLMNNKLASSSWLGEINIWDPATGECLQTLEIKAWYIFFPLACGQLLVVSSNGQTIKILDPHTGKCLKELDGHKDCIRSVRELHNGHIISGSWDGEIKFWA